MLLQTTLSLAAAAAVINLWLAIRVIRLRFAKRVIHGDGGEELLQRRMRAQANFIENVPITLILIAAIELTGRGAAWLAAVGAIFMLARLAHVFGMDLNRPNAMRGAGMTVTMLVQAGLAIFAVLIAIGRA